MRSTNQKSKVELLLPKSVINAIENHKTSKHEQGKLLLLAHYYYNNSKDVVTIVTMNKYLAVKNSKGAELRQTLCYLGVITLIHKGVTARNQNGQIYRKGLNTYIPTDSTSKKVQYELNTTYARALIGNYGWELCELLDLVITPLKAKKELKKQKVQTVTSTVKQNVTPINTSSNLSDSDNTIDNDTEFTDEEILATFNAINIANKPFMTALNDFFGETENERDLALRKEVREMYNIFQSL